MRLRILLAAIVSLGLTFSCTTPASAGVIKALVEKAKEKPTGLHAKIHAKKHAMKLAKAQKKAARKGECCNQ
jgi:hypothetical protein